VIYLIVEENDTEQALLFTHDRIYFGKDRSQDLFIDDAFARHAVLIKKGNAFVLKRRRLDALVYLNGEMMVARQASLTPNDAFTIGRKTFKPLPKEGYEALKDETRFESFRSEIEKATASLGMVCERVGSHIEARAQGPKQTKVTLKYYPKSGLVLEGELLDASRELLVRPFSRGFKGLAERWRSRRQRPQTLSKKLYVEGDVPALALLAELANPNTFRGVVELSLKGPHFCAKWDLQRFNNVTEGCECLLNSWLQALEHE